MDIDIIKKAGLTDSQAKAYITLIENSGTSAAQLAELIGETRTNTYAIIDKLLKYGLVSKKEDVKYGAKYNANHPSALELLAESRRKAIARNEKAIKDALPDFIDYYYEYDDRPGIMTFIGKDGIKKIYNDVIEEGHSLEYLRSPQDSGYMSSEYIKEYRTKRANAGIITRPISPDLPRSRHNPKINEKYKITERAWLHPNDYTSNVEWDVYGDRVSIITYGAEAISVTIQSKSIAESMKQIFNIMRMGAKESYAKWKKERPSNYHTPVND